MNFWRMLDMGQKKKYKKLAESNIKILRSGKIKIAKGEKINLKPFVNDSIKNTIVSRIDGIISKEEVVVDTENLRLDITTNMTNDIKVSELVSRVTNPKTSTIVLVVNKKDALDSFNFLDSGSLGIILRTSTLASIYSDQEVKNKWVELNKDDTSSFTNVLFVPKIMMFINPENGKILKTPYYINLLLLAVPSVKKMSDGIEAVSETDAVARVISEICDAAIKCGAKDLIYDPYAYKLFRSDSHTTAELWNEITTSQRFIEQLDSVIFAIESEELFIVFNAKRMIK